MCVVLPVCMSVLYMHAVPIRGQNRALDPLGLEFKKSVSYNVGAGKRTQFLCKRNWHS